MRGFMAFVEGGPAVDGRLECLFGQPSPVGRHVGLSEWAARRRVGVCCGFVR